MTPAEDDDKGPSRGGNFPKWPDAFAPTYVADQSGFAGMWDKSGTGILFAVFPSQEKSYLMVFGSPTTYYLLKSVSGTTFTVQEEDDDELTGSAWTFTATVSGGTLTVSTSGQPSLLADGAYTSAEIPTE